jgi:hypothetical protein
MKIPTISIGRKFVLFVLCAAVVFSLGARVRTAYEIETGGEVQVGLIYDPLEAERHPDVRGVWDRYFEKQGIPHAWISENDLLLVSTRSIVSQLPAIIFPDSLAQYVSGMLASSLAEYVKEGGTLVLVADPGTRNEDGRFLYRSVFGSIAGVEYLQYGSLRSAPIARTSLLSDDTRVEAWSGNAPAITERPLGEGHVFYIDLPVGYLLSHGDGFPMRAFVRRALFDVAEVPHLVASPDGEFLPRFVRTSAVFARRGQAWHVSLYNDLGLRHIAFALPGETASRTPPSGTRFAGKDGGFQYFVVDTDSRHYAGTF